MATIQIINPAADNTPFPAVISGNYSLQGGGDALVTEGDGEKGAKASASLLTVIQITVTLKREDTNATSDHDATDDGNGQWHLNKPGGLAAVKYIITAVMTSPANAVYARAGIQN